LRDRLDLIVDVGAVNLTRLHKIGASQTDAARARVEDARARQAKRQGAVVLNSSLPGAALGSVCLLDGGAELELRNISRRYGLTGRGFHGVLRVARSIADLEGNERITVADLQEACAYRLR
jgi:magnesium chelatase family protein